MRYVIMSLIAVLCGLGQAVAEPLAAHSAPPMDKQSLADAQNAFGKREETPNERRRRLGQPIEASFPAPQYGEALETPNQMRARMAKPVKPAEAVSITGVASLR